MQLKLNYRQQGGGVGLAEDKVGGQAGAGMHLSLIDKSEAKIRSGSKQEKNLLWGFTIAFGQCKDMLKKTKGEF